MANITLLLLVKNAQSSLDDLLASVRQQDHGHALSILAVDSGSMDRTLEILDRYQVRSVSIPAGDFNHGVTRNLAAREASSSADYLVYLSQDAIPADENWLASLIQPLEEESQVAGVFSRHLPSPGTSPSVARQLTQVWQTGSDERLIKEIPDDPRNFERNRVYYATFSNTSSAIRRSVWEKIPFRKLNFAEDADWADRALRAGYKIIYEPASKVIHAHDYSLIEQFRQNVDHTEAMIQLFDPPVFHDRWLLVKQLLSLPPAVWRDWKFMRTAPEYRRSSLARQIVWMARSPLWHLASHLGTWIGVRLDHLPESLQLLVRRQERLKLGIQDR